MNGRNFDRSAYYVNAVAQELGAVAGTETLIDGWSLSQCPQTGVFEWYPQLDDPEDGPVVYATPYWDGDEGISVSIMTPPWEEATSHGTFYLPAPTFDPKDDARSYVDAMVPILLAVSRGQSPLTYVGGGEFGAVADRAWVFFARPNFRAPDAWTVYARCGVSDYTLQRDCDGMAAHSLVDALCEHMDVSNLVASLGESVANIAAHAAGA